MKLSKAIEIVTHPKHRHYFSHDLDFIDALQILIEAAKFTVDIRTRYPTLIHETLPGETEDHCKYCGLVHTGIECPDRGCEK